MARNKKRSVKTKNIFDRLKDKYGSFSANIKNIEKDDEDKDRKSISTSKLKKDGWVKGDDNLWRKKTTTGTIVRASSPEEFQNNKTPYNPYSIYNRKKNESFGYGRYQRNYGNNYNNTYGNSYDDTFGFINSYRPVIKKMASNLESLQSGEALCSVYFAVLPNDAQKGILAAFKVLSSISKSMISDSKISLDIKTRNHEELKNLFNKCEYSVALSQEMFTEEEDLGKAIDIFLGNGILEFSQILYRDDKYEKKVIKPMSNKLLIILYECFEYSRITLLLKTNFPGFYTFAEKRIENHSEKLEKLLTKTNNSHNINKADLKNILHTILYHIRLNIEIPLDIIDDAHVDIKCIYIELNKLMSNITESPADSFSNACTIYDIIDKAYHKIGFDISEYFSTYINETYENIKKVMGTSVKIIFNENTSGGNTATAYNLVSFSNDKVYADANIENNSEIRNIIQSAYAKLFEPPASGKSNIILTNVNVSDCATDKYNRDYAIIAPYISVLKKELRLKTNSSITNLKGLRTGNFDDTKIVEAVQGVNTVYKKRFKTSSNKLNFGLLIDESGSMDRYKINMARQIAILFSECFSTLKNVNFSIYGHSADIKTATVCNMFVYKKVNDNFNKFKLGTIQARNNNRDGDAIMETCEQMKLNSKSGILVVVSDGMPCANNYNGYGHTKEMVKKYENEGFDIISISIDASYDPSVMYKNNVKFTDISTLPNDVGKLLKTLIHKHLKKITKEF